VVAASTVFLKQTGIAFIDLSAICVVEVVVRVGEIGIVYLG